jgi:hypothetical protein
MKKEPGIKTKLYKAFVMKDDEEVQIDGWIYGTSLENAEENFKAKYPHYTEFRLKQRH